MHRHLVTLGALLSMACSGSSGGGGGGGDDTGGGGDDQPTCEDACRFAQECDPEESVEDCLEYCGCVVPLMRPEFDSGIWSCLMRSCDNSEDGCFEEIAGTLHPSPSSAAFTDACNSRRTECGNAFNDDTCFSLPLSDEVIDEVGPCLDEACGDVSSCIASITAACK